MDVDILDIDDQGIHALIGLLQQNQWLMSGTYAKLNKVDKIRCFSKLEEISKLANRPWLVTRDLTKLVTLKRNRVEGWLILTE